MDTVHIKQRPRPDFRLKFLNRNSLEMIAARSSSNVKAFLLFVKPSRHSARQLDFYDSYMNDIGATDYT